MPGYARNNAVKLCCSESASTSVCLYMINPGAHGLNMTSGDCLQKVKLHSNGVSIGPVDHNTYMWLDCC